MENHNKEINSLIIRENYDDCTEIIRISSDNLQHFHFALNYMELNIPVVITGLEIKTEISKKWFNNNEIIFDDLEEILKDHDVPVANCSKMYFDSHEKMQMKFSDYVKYWKNKENRDTKLYLKDFHLKNEFPGLDFYHIPSYFSSDWLNEYLIDSGKEDYRFIYFGPENSWTPFHSDVFGSFSWSANIFGTKKWLILPPGEEQKLKDKLGNFPFSISEDLLDNFNVKYFTIIQECGECIFVPSHWYHQVWNITDTVSVNHNWFNAFNIKYISMNLINHLSDVEKEISDCNDMENYEEHCQLMLKASFGLNYKDFIDILTHIAHKRLEQINPNNPLERLHDLKTISLTLECFKNETGITAENFISIENIIKNINENFTN
ncbi:unnamed protein product [Diamesa serratosioi]